MIDRFGDRVELRNVRKDRFEVTVMVSLNSTFYAWVFQFVEQKGIPEPEYVRTEYVGIENANGVER